jgi:hypothetical protein
MYKKMKAGAEGGIRSTEDGMGMDVDVDVDEEPSPLPGSSPRLVTNGFGNGSVSSSIQDHDCQPANGATTAQYESALNQAISYGRTLSSEYKADARLEIQTMFKRTSGIVAWDDPMEAGGVAAEIAGHEARVVLASELNQAILSESFFLLHGFLPSDGVHGSESQGRPTHPALETLYRHTAACIVQLGLMGVGAAAFADMSKEFLDT